MKRAPMILQHDDHEPVLALREFDQVTKCPTCSRDLAVALPTQSKQVLVDPFLVNTRRVTVRDGAAAGAKMLATLVREWKSEHTNSTIERSQ